MKRQLQISVRALVEYCLRSGDLVFEFSAGGAARAVEGIRAHQKVQQSRPDEYVPEVHVSHLIETDGFDVKITGRLDGVYRYPDRVIVDEIKSTTRNLDFIEEDERPVHWGQVKVYGYLYGLKEGLENVETQLTYINVDSGDTREFRKEFTFSELEEFFNGLLERYLAWAETLEQWFNDRDESIRALTFPFETYRPGQRRMALEIYRAVEKEEQLIVEAPTGIGKTMAAVFPAVKAMGAGFIEKFFYLTAKTTGRAVARNAIEDLAGKGLKLKSLTLTAKDKICFCPDSTCHPDECEFAKGYFDRVNHAVESVFKETDAMTREVIEEEARKFNICPFEFSLDLSFWVDAIICDYNYAFDPRVYLRRFFIEESENTSKKFAFLVDEANNMVDRSREMFSAELFKQKILDVRRAVKGQLKEVFQALGRINTKLVALRKECKEEGKPVAMETYPGELTPLLRRFISTAEQWLIKNIKTPFRQEVMDLYFEINWFLKVADNFDGTYAFCLEETDDDFRIKLFCMDPSVQLSEALERSRSVVFFSATLSPVDYFRHILGCDPGAQELSLPSPFPPENFCLTVADRVSTLYKYRQRTKTTIAKFISTLVRQHPGNYLVFFPSYQYMKMVYEVFLLLCPGIECIVQRPGMTELERDEFLDNFSHSNRSEGKTLAGFAVMGGIFGEGIDLKGDRLTAAVIVGVGLPGICLERELIKEYFGQLNEKGFEYAYLYPGMNRVFQAAGRVIRSGTDRGVVLLIGHRFNTPQYNQLFPRHWQEPVSVPDEHQLVKILDYFWQ